MTQRNYLPTLGELVDRLAIVMLKAIYIPEHNKTYLDESNLITSDIESILNELPGKDIRLDAYCVRAILVIMLANVTIWNNESEARKGGDSQDKLLKFTHSINGLRAQAKNIIARVVRDRVDLKVDSLAASLPSDLGQWNVL
jgi:hypothetical protein